jgi:hypothetical protein
MVIIDPMSAYLYEDEDFLHNNILMTELVRVMRILGKVHHIATLVRKIILKIFLWFRYKLYD